MSEARVPFAWRGGRWYGSRSSSLRVRCVPDGEGLGGYSLAAVDVSGLPVLEIGSVVVREVDRGVLRGASRVGEQSLFSVGWVEQSVGGGQRLGAVGLLGAGVGTALFSEDVDVVGFGGFEELVGFVEAGGDAPGLVFVGAAVGDGLGVGGWGGVALGLVQGWLWV